MKSLVYYLLVALVLWQAYQHITKVEPASIADSITPTAHVPDAAMAVTLQPQITKATLAPKQPEPSNFSCDGRTHCSQMRSLAEAQFFL